jgi:hypothetical protein
MMRRMRRLAAIAFAAVLLAGCGRSATPAPKVTHALGNWTIDRVHPCWPLAGGERAAALAEVRAFEREHRVAGTYGVDLVPGPSFGGRRDARGSTALTRTRSDDGSPPPGDAFRIVDDPLYAHRDGRWLDYGSAAGLTLDVGRELLFHDFLLQPTRRCLFLASSPPGLQSIEGTVDMAAFRRRAAEHGTARVTALADRIRRVEWTVDLGAGTGDRVFLTATGPAGIAATAVTTWGPRGDRGMRAVPAIEAPVDATPAELPSSPFDLLRLLSSKPA